MKTARIVLKNLGRALCLVGCVWFLLPFLHGGFALGAMFGFCVCLGGFLLLTFYPRWVRERAWKRRLVRIVAVLYGLGLCWAGYLTALIVSVQPVELPKNATVIVLGSQVYSAERMGVSLSNRVQAAYEYLVENPGSLAVVTGGQGGDEPCPEALTAKNALVRMGIDPWRVLMEDQSTNTLENLEFALDIALKEGLTGPYLLATQQFHQWRALQTAGLLSQAGGEFYPLVAETDPILYPEYFGRELLSLTKYHLLTLPKYGWVSAAENGGNEP